MYQNVHTCKALYQNAQTLALKFNTNTEVHQNAQTLAVIANTCKCNQNAQTLALSSCCGLAASTVQYM